MLYNQRKRLKERAEAEAQGENFWTPAFSEKVRTRLLFAVGEAAGANRVSVLERARHLILKAEGVPYLQRYGHNVTPAEDFLDHFTGCRDDVMPTAIEALYSAMQTFGIGNLGYFVPTIDVDAFGRDLNQILEEERVAFDFARGEMVSFKSKELQQDVVEPAMKLLHNPKFSEAEKAYQDALEEVAKGKAGNAITDAGTALQETLTALGCKGDSLGPLIRSAKDKGLLAAHDARITKAIEDVMEWVSADRSQKGDSHKADKAEKEDAWFIIHVVGALIVRLVGASGR
jgi:hypothetical protein